MRLIVLASKSPYRKALLSRLPLDFITHDSNINEDLDLPSHQALVETLALEKAKAAQLVYPEALCIGSDTLGTLGDLRLGKSASEALAQEQLQQMSGQIVDFYTGIALYDHQQNLSLQHTVVTSVKFRTLTPKMIQHYLDKEKPFQSCASFKSETSAIALIESCTSEDPTAIVGLPLITLCSMLMKAGIEVF